VTRTPERLRHWICAEGLDQRRFAEEVGASPGTICNLETP